ncbi:transcriptional regulator, GntR family [Rhodopseudomonas palustris BisB18]|uniref:Transcriptional regulator, GntR family n=2 Tax=Rhodopseudomonas palustris TaxID=1076 RepID=Q216W2_RHOPB
MHLLRYGTQYKMAVNLNNDTVSILHSALREGMGPKYRRLARRLEALILSRGLRTGEKLPAHRDLAALLGVTAGTISRAYGELRKIGLISSRVGDGTFVLELAKKKRKETDFKPYGGGEPGRYDLSRNTAIPGRMLTSVSETLRRLALQPEALEELLQYGPELGLNRHRAAGARWLSNHHSDANAEQIVCVNGGQHGLFCVLMALLERGDTLVSEQFTYPGLISACRILGINLVGLKMDDEGLIPKSLDAVCRTATVRALFCTPTLQNPTTAVLGLERRAEIARLCRAHNLLVIEDDAHGVLVKDRHPHIGHFVPERSILISSLSKAIAAGLRVGYVHAPLPLVGRIGTMVRTNCWMANPLAFEMVSLWIEDGSALRFLEDQIEEIVRRKTLVQPLLDGFVVKTHPRSPHFWIEVPSPWRASEIASELRQKNCLVAPAEAFAVDRDRTVQFLRASVSSAEKTDAAISEGFRILSAVLRNPSTTTAIH